jgi:hypothetical protein
MTVGGGARGATLPNLTNGERYTITVAAINAVGRGPAVAANPVIPADPVSVPGMPQNLTVAATTKHVDATVTWSAAAPHGAPVTAYHLSWVRDDGSRPGSTTVSGATLSFVITGIWSGTDIPFTVRVIAENRAGQGPAASVHKAPGSQPKITIAEGAPTTGDRCHAPDCARVNATLTGFEPNTTYGLTLSTPDNPQVQTPPEPVTTDANGSATYNELDYDVPDQTVWIQLQTPAGLIISNKITWRTPGGRQPTVTVTKGALTNQPDCPNPCNYMHVVMTGFQPGTQFEIMPFSSNPDYTNPGSGQTTDSRGDKTFEAFYYGSAGSEVWVEVRTESGALVATSAKFSWR